LDYVVFKSDVIFPAVNLTDATLFLYDLCANFNWWKKK